MRQSIDRSITIVRLLFFFYFSFIFRLISLIHLDRSRLNALTIRSSLYNLILQAPDLVLTTRFDFTQQLQYIKF